MNGGVFLLTIFLICVRLASCDSEEEPELTIISTESIEQPSPVLQCRRFSLGERLMLYIDKQCPVHYDDACLDLDMLDPTEFIRYRCHDAFPPEINASFVEIINATVLMNILQKTTKENRRNNWCLLSLFYSPSCPFSARIAPAFNAIPSYFTKIKAVALDATDFSRLNARYGITGTPTVILWINGIAVARMEERELSIDGLENFIETWTDLESSRSDDDPDIFPDDPVRVVVTQTKDTLNISIALVTLFITLAYYQRNALIDRYPIIVSRFGFNPDDVKRFLNGF